ncbi:MAG: isoaspartyl peptidase/L-asparaginase [Phycisphaerales bacterium]|nr:isoaspartyl peptidase/L-asparaginase [Phycisphaerales bacterium]
MSGEIIVSTWSFGRRGHDAAWGALVDGGSSLDAVEKVCRVAEDDPEIDSVGWGGRPDRDGRMTLDGCIMLDPRQCGSVACVERHRHPVSMARQVMERTDHVMLVGPLADDFANACGMPEEPLLAPSARAAFDARQVGDGGAGGAGAPPIDSPSGALFPDEQRWRHHDTIGTLAIDGRGVLAGACSTSGMAWKVPGRVGDSPIIGHGLYVRPQVGAATGTGTGELVMGECGSFLAVERMAMGDSPTEACVHVLKRILDAGPIESHETVAMLALREDGVWGSASIRPGYRTSVRRHDQDEALEPHVVLLER